MEQKGQVAENGKQKTDDALRIFGKYQSGFARRLKKTEALKMLQTEFGMSESESEIMFQAFDKDSNDVLSLWEFRQFYQTIGSNAHAFMEMFHTLEKDDSGLVDISQCFDSLQKVESGKGKLTDEEVEMFLKTTAGESKSIDLHKFLNMMCRIKAYKG